MARSYDNTDTDADLLKDWEDTDVIHTHEIKNHRASHPLGISRPIVVVASIFALATTAGVVGVRTSDNRRHDVVAFDPSYKNIDDRMTSAEEMNMERELLLAELRRKRESERLAASRNSARLIAAQPIIKPIVKPTVKPPVRRTVARKKAVTAQRASNPTVNYRVTSCYGWRDGRMHKGIDFATRTGNPIYAVAAGTIVQAGWKYRGLGYSVVVKHANGYMTVYAHASRVLVRPGQRVSAGTRIALIGSTGHSSGPHLHLGLAKTSNLGSIFNTFVNPAPWLSARKVNVGRCS